MPSYQKVINGLSDLGMHKMQEHLDYYIIVGRGLTGNDAVTITGCTVTGTTLTCTASSTTNIARWGLVIGRDQSNGYSRITDCTVKNSSIVSTNRWSDWLYFKHRNHRSNQDKKLLCGKL